MNIITFPIFNLTFSVSPVAFSPFGIPIYWYAIFIVFAIIIGIFLCKKEDGKYGINFQDIVDLLIYLLPISFICARLYYVAFHWEYFGTNLIQIFNFRTGGLAIYGGIIGGGLTTIVFCKKRKIKLRDMLDYIIPYVALGQAMGRLGNFVNSEAHGGITDVPWRMGIIENGNYIEVHPTFLYESIVNIFIFILLMLLKKKRKYEGQLTYLYLTLYSFFRMLIEGLRTDSLMFFDLRISQILSFVIFVIFCSILLFQEIKNGIKK